MTHFWYENNTTYSCKIHTILKNCHDSFPLFHLGPFIGRLVDRFQCKTIIMAGSILMTIGTLIPVYFRYISILYITYGFISSKILLYNNRNFLSKFDSVCVVQKASFNAMPLLYLRYRVRICIQQRHSSYNEILYYQTEYGS